MGAEIREGSRSDLPDVPGEAERPCARACREVEHDSRREGGMLAANEGHLAAHVEVIVAGETVGAERDRHARVEPTTNRKGLAAEEGVRSWTVHQRGS
jgi:hypothetical protein